MDQPKENIVGATVEACAKVREVTKACASQVHEKAHSWSYKALTGICASKWLGKAEGTVVGALNAITGHHKEEPKEAEVKVVEVV